MLTFPRLALRYTGWQTANYFASHWAQDVSLNQSNLTALMPQIAAGSKQAFKKLYDQTSGVAYSVALKLTGSPSVAQDVLQEAYIKIWSNAGRYQASKGEVLPWVLSVVRYRAIDLIRADQRRADSLGEYGDSLISEGGLADEPYKIVSDEMQRCLNTLTESQRRSIAATFLYGFTHQELADLLSKPLGTVKSQIRRALLRLKECLNQ